MLSPLLFGLLLTAVAGHERDTSGPWNCAETCGSMHYNCHQDCAGPECNPIHGNYLSTDSKGKHVIDLIEISAGGYQYTHRGETAYPGTPGECCRACRDEKDCNLWTFCNRPDGCGWGCKSYIESVKGWPPGNSSRCNGDKWPFLMCSLKKVKDTRYLKVQSADGSQGWVSGIHHDKVLG